MLDALEAAQALRHVREQLAHGHELVRRHASSAAATARGLLELGHATVKVAAHSLGDTRRVGHCGSCGSCGCCLRRRTGREGLGCRRALVLLVGATLVQDAHRNHGRLALRRRTDDRLFGFGPVERVANWRSRHFSGNNDSELWKAGFRCRCRRRLCHRLWHRLGRRLSV